MHLAVITQVLDRRDAVLGFFHTWCVEFAQSVDELTVFAQDVGDIDLPSNARAVSLGRDAGHGKPTMLARLTRGLMTLPKPAAIWAHMVPRFVLYAAPVARVRGIPMSLWYTHAGIDRSLRMAVPLVKRVFTASEESFRLESGFAKRVVTGHGIDAQHFDFGEAVRTTDVLTVGRVAPSKGQRELLDALEQLVEARGGGVAAMPVTEVAGDILLARDRAYADEVARRAAAWSGRVRLLGAVPYVGIADVMRRAKIMVNVSQTGSVDKVVLEAMACGTIPLSCNESFEPILRDFADGTLLFPHGDTDVLTERLDALLSLGDDERTDLGRALREHVVSHHDVRRLMPAMVEIMERDHA